MKLVLIFSLLFCTLGNAQLNFQLGQNLTVGNKQVEYEVDFENSIGYYYSDFRKAGTETFFKVSSYNPWNSDKFSIKYTLEFGLKYFYYYSASTHTSTLSYLENQQFNNGASNFKSRAFSWTNGADFIYRISDKLTLINTLGVKLEAVNRIRGEKIWGSGSGLSFYNLPIEQLPFTNPMIAVKMAPQLLINLKGFSLGIHVNQDLMVINNFVNKIKSSNINYGKAQLSTFTSFGVSFMPNFYLVEVDQIDESNLIE